MPKAPLLLASNPANPIKPPPSYPNDQKVRTFGPSTTPWMLNIGKFNTLTILRREDIGLYLDGGSDGPILLPRRYVPEEAAPGQQLEVFIYHDSEDRLIATTLKPAAEVGQFAFLRVTSVTKFGAFLDWGLPKDLLVPFREQPAPMQANRRYLVYIYLDETSRRIVASARLGRFVRSESRSLKEGEEVSLWVAKQTDLGFKVIVNETFWGLLYHNEVFRPIHIGDRLTGYVKQIRPNGNLDISLQPTGYRQLIPDAAAQLLHLLRKSGGFLRLTDASPPQEIYDILGMSKKTFKKALGSLYKDQKVEITEDGIRLK